MRRDAVALRELAAGMTGQRSTGRPQTDSGTAATALLTGIEGVGGRNVLTWRGATGADGYLVQRATGGGGWLTITPTPLSANDAPWTDITAQVVVSPPAGAPGSVTATSSPRRSAQERSRSSFEKSSQPRQVSCSRV